MTSLPCLLLRPQRPAMALPGASHGHALRARRKPLLLKATDTPVLLVTAARPGSPRLKPRLRLFTAIAMRMLELAFSWLVTCVLLCVTDGPPASSGRWPTRPTLQAAFLGSPSDWPPSPGLRLDPLSVTLCYSPPSFHTGNRLAASFLVEDGADYMERAFRLVKEPGSVRLGKRQSLQGPPAAQLAPVLTQSARCPQTAFSYLHL